VLSIAAPVTPDLGKYQVVNQICFSGKESISEALFGSIEV